MKKLFKKLTTFMLCAVVAVCLLPTTANAATDEKVGGVVAVSDGVQYNADIGYYYPEFSEMYAVSTNGTPLRDIAYRVAQGAVYTAYNSGATSMALESDPVDGETYYSFLVIQNPEGNLRIDESLIDIRIKGYDIEILEYFTRDGGSSIRIYYSLEKIAYDVYVGGVGLKPGDVLKTGSDTPTQTIGSSYYVKLSEDGNRLIFRGYDYTGSGYKVSDYGSALIYSKNSIQIYMDGWTSTLSAASGDTNTYGIYCEGDLTFLNDYRIKINVPKTAVYAAGNIIVNDTAVQVDGKCEYGVVAANGALNVADKATIEVAEATNCGISAYNGININNSTVKVKKANKGLYTSKSTADIVISNDSNITVENSSYLGMYAVDSIAISDSTVSVNAVNFAADSYNGNMIITDSEVTLKGDYAAARGPINLNGNVRIFASKEKNGTLGEFIAANIGTYKYIKVVQPAVYVGGQGLYDGSYYVQGTVTDQKPAVNDYAYYSDGVLTLSGLYLSYPYNTYTVKNIAASIYSEDSLEIVIDGEAFIRTNRKTPSSTSTTKYYGIVCDEYLTIKGSGTDKLTIEGEYGIYSGNNVLIKDAELVIDECIESIYTNRAIAVRNSTVTVSDTEEHPTETGIKSLYGASFYDSTINVNAKYGIYNANNDLSFSNCNVTVNAEEYAIELDSVQSLYVTDTVMNLTSSGGSGLVSYGYTNIDRSTVTADAKGKSVVYGGEGLEIGDSTVEAKGGEYGLNSKYGQVNIENSNVTAKGTKEAVFADTGLKCGNSVVKASTQFDGTLGEFVPENLSTYKYIKFEPGAPDAPTNVKAVSDPATGKPKISWDAVEGATKYQVYRCIREKGNYGLMKTVTDTSYINANAVTGNIYYYKVVAVGANGKTSEHSSIVQCRTILPQVTGLTAKNDVETGKPEIRWDAVNGAIKYQIWRSTAPNGTYRLINTVTGTSTINKNAVTGTKYFYKIVAVHATRNTNSAKSAAVECMTDLAQPKVTATNDLATGKPKLTWQAVDGAVKYNVYRCVNKDGSYGLMKSVTDTSYINSNAVAGKLYYYKVVAVYSNTAANSAQSEIVQRTADLARPVVTATVNANGKPVIKWNSISGATKYTVYILNADGTQNKTWSTTGLAMTHAAAESGKTYGYQVVAVHTNTAANSAKSVKVTATAK